MTVKSKKQQKNLRYYPVIGLLQEMRNLFLGKIKILKASNERERERDRENKKRLLLQHPSDAFILSESVTENKTENPNVVVSQYFIIGCQNIANMRLFFTQTHKVQNKVSI